MAAKVALFESSQERNHLNGFAQSHLISDNPPSLLAVKFPEPLHTSLLVPEREGRREGTGGREREGGKKWEGGREGREAGGKEQEGGNGREGTGGRVGENGEKGEKGENGEKRIESRNRGRKKTKQVQSYRREILPYLPVQLVPDTSRYPESTPKHSIRFPRLFLLLFLLMLPVSAANTKSQGAIKSIFGCTVTEVTPILRNGLGCTTQVQCKYYISTNKSVTHFDWTIGVARSYCSCTFLL